MKLLKLTAIATFAAIPALAAYTETGAVTLPQHAELSVDERTHVIAELSPDERKHVIAELSVQERDHLIAQWDPDMRKERIG